MNVATCAARPSSIPVWQQQISTRAAEGEAIVPAAVLSLTPQYSAPFWAQRQTPDQRALIGGSV